MQDGVDKKCVVRGPNLNEFVGFTVDARNRLVCYPSGISSSACELLLRKGDCLHFDRLPSDLAERLHSCGIMTVVYVGDGYVVDIHDEQSQKFSLRLFAEAGTEVVCSISALGKSIFDTYPREDVFKFFGWE